MSHMERFLHSHKGCFILLSNPCGTSQSTPLGPASSLALTLVPFSNRYETPTKFTLLRDPASLLVHHIVSTPFGEQPPRWQIAQCLALIPFVTAQVHRYQILSFMGFPFRDSPQGFKTHTIGSGFHILITGCFILLSNRCGTSRM